VTGAIPTTTIGNTVVIFGGTVSALGNIALNNVTVNSVSTPITAAQGGTGLVTLPANNVLVGNGTGSLVSIAPGSINNVLTSNGTAWISAAAGALAGNVTYGNTTVNLGGTATTVGNLTLTNTNVATGVIGSAVTATTQAAGTSNTAVATTAFVNNTALGVSQTWQDVTASRALNTTYTNSTGKPIMVIVGCISAGGAYDPTIVINSTTLNRFGAAVNNGAYALASFIVPNGQTYSITATSATLASWSELR